MKAIFFIIALLLRLFPQRGCCGTFDRPVSVRRYARFRYGRIEIVFEHCRKRPHR